MRFPACRPQDDKRHYVPLSAFAYTPARAASDGGRALTSLEFRARQREQGHAGDASDRTDNRWLREEMVLNRSDDATMGDVVRLLDAVQHMHATGTLRAAHIMLNVAETTDDRAKSRRNVQKVRCALDAVDRFMGKLAFRPEQRRPLEEARDKVRRRLEAIEQRGDPIPARPVRPSCVLLQWPGTPDRPKA